MMMDKAFLGGYLKGFNAAIGGIGAVPVSHLLFADDTLVFCDAVETRLNYLGQVLTWLHIWLGRRMILDRSLKF